MVFWGVRRGCPNQYLCVCVCRLQAQERTHRLKRNTDRRTHAMSLRSRPCLLLLLLGTLLVPGTGAASTCNNTNPCMVSCLDCAVGEYIPDPLNCRGYYRCQGTGIDDYYEEPFDCESGKVFDPDTHQCVPGDACLYNCPAPSLDCNYECPSAGTAMIPHETECSTYYLCSSGAISLTLTCDASKPYFDGTKCQSDVSRCCHCHPYCTAAEGSNNERVPDPQDCRRYFICFAQGNPTNFVQCPDGQHFDDATKQCTDKIGCNTDRACTNVVDMDGCIDPFTCLTSGFFAACPNDCQADYYHCTAPTGDFQEPSTCTSGLVFHPSSHTCISADDCP